MISSGHDPRRPRAELEPNEPDGREFARFADVAVVGLTLAAGLVATVFGLGAPPREPGGDPNAGEARALAELPPLTWANVLEGRFTGAVEAYVADRVPLRGSLLGVDTAMRRARGFAPREDDVVMYSVSPEAMDLGADPDADLDVDESDPIAFSVPPPVVRPADGDAIELDPEALGPGIDTGLDTPDGAPARSSSERNERRTRSVRRTSTRVMAGILIRDGRAMQRFGGLPTGAPAYAGLLNAIHDAVGDRATVYAMIVPTAQEFYLPEGSRSRVRDERPNIVATYARLSPSIRTVDVHAELAAHTEENLYFRTDHHWTGIGAYYGYRAFCRAARVEPVPLDRMERRVIARRWLGSLFRLTRDPDLRADQVEIAVPPTVAEVRVAGERRGTDRVVPLFHRGSGGYGVFLGGDYPIMRVRTSTRNGRRAILVKNSYGNAFAVYLVSHYEELVFIDYRAFRGSLLQLLEESDTPTDLIFMNGTLTANSRAHTALIQRLLDPRG